MQFIFNLGYFVLFLATGLSAKSSLVPFVVLPPFLRLNNTSTITITPIRVKSENVDIQVLVNGIKGTRTFLIYTQQLKAKRAGSPHSISFELNSFIDKAVIKIDVQGHSMFESELLSKPDLGTLHIHTDKNIYSAGEIVSVRALPLTYSGTLYDGTIEFTLVNPDGFELLRKYNSTNDGYIPLQFHLPEHLFYGEWRIIARPKDFRDNDLTFDTIFLVRNYMLPSFKIIAYLGEGNNVDSTDITVNARYFHGAPISGTLSLFCTLHGRSSESGKSQLILQSQIVDGSWKQRVNLTMCFHNEQKSPSTVRIDIRDHGTGNRGETQLKYDPMASLFDIIPLRPSFNTKTKNILFLAQSTGAMAESIVDFTFTCLGDMKKSNKKSEARLGDIVNFEIPHEWKKCYVIMVQASRRLIDSSSRIKTIMMPNLSSVGSLETSWINILNPYASYKVGDKLTVQIPQNIARKVNYMVLCNSNKVSLIGQVRDDGSLSITVTQAMVGLCILFVYTTHSKPTTDMIQFYVRDECQVSTFASKETVKPGQNVTFTLNGDPYGLAVLRAVDDRLNNINMQIDPIRFKCWDFTMFNRPELKGYQTKLVNFVSIKEVKRALDQICSPAAAAFFQLYGICPDAKITASAFSNFCLKVIVHQCMNPEQPNVSTSCDPKNPKRCDAGATIPSSINGFKPIQRLLFVPEKQNSSNMLSDMPLIREDDESKVRERFQEVWLFDSYNLGASGTTSTSLLSPDSIGSWSISSVFWSPGQNRLCHAKDVQVVSTKEVFMDIDLPRSVYINETITVKVSVTATNVDIENKYSICISELSRKVCADMGSFGQHGRPTYTRVVVSKQNPTDTKTFTMKFLVTGKTNITFKLRRETSFPGKHHCDVGDVLDSVRIHLNIAKRAETEEHYKRLILNAKKPLAKVIMNDVQEVFNDAVSTPMKDAIDVHEYRLNQDTSSLVTEINVNILDTNSVFSFTIDISKFLPNLPSALDTNRRVKRGVLDYGNAFLSDILKKLSIELYQFKRIRMQDNIDFRTIEASENKIGSLISDMLRFSDCKNESICGFAEFGRPQKPQDRSCVLTALASSLLCEASADERLVCGGVRLIHETLLRNFEHEDIDLHDMVDLDHQMDKQWFVKALLLQVSRDCAMYHCVKNNKAWSQLYLDFYNLDENWPFDDRSVAALAYMGTNATSEIMRIKMIEEVNSNMIPFWSAGNVLTKSKTKLSTFEEVNRLKKIKSGDVLVNSLGILAFISAGAEGKSIDWDPLANWLYEQQLDDGTYDNALDTYFASRALFEYRFRKVDVDFGNDLQVTIQCSACDTRIVNVTESSSEVYLPTHIRSVTMTTKGHGKVKAGIRILATKRQRSRRGLTQDDYYPVRITVVQERVFHGTIKQTVCLKVLSPVLTTMEITHGLFTGYTSTPSSVAVLSNSTSLHLNNLPAISSFAVHFVLDGFHQNIPLCYEIGVSEPNHSHEPFNLAPVAIVARHPINDVVGLMLISHPDQLRMKRSISTHLIPEVEKHQKKRKTRNTIDIVKQRIIRGIVDDSIDTVCFAGGLCSCAETSCGVQCGVCLRDTVENLRDHLSDDDSFGALVKVLSTERVLIDSSYYTHVSTEVRDKSGAGKRHLSDKLEIWLRDCNPRCIGNDLKNEEKFFILGECDAITVDSHGRQHYILRDTDRFEQATSDCGALAGVIVLL